MFQRYFSLSNIKWTLYGQEPDLLTQLSLSGGYCQVPPYVLHLICSFQEAFIKTMSEAVTLLGELLDTETMNRCPRLAWAPIRTSMNSSAKSCLYPGQVIMWFVVSMGLKFNNGEEKDSTQTLERIKIQLGLNTEHLLSEHRKKKSTDPVFLDSIGNRQRVGQRNRSGIGYMSSYKGVYPYIYLSIITIYLSIQESVHR